MYRIFSRFTGSSASDDMNVLGKRLFSSTEHLATIRYYDDEPRKPRSNSKEEINEENTETSTQNTNNKGLSGRKLAREQVWRNLSQPKHPKTSLKQLREKIEAEVNAESWSKSYSISRVQTLPQIVPECRGLIASVDKGDKNSKSNKSMYLTVPNEIYASKSDENLATDPVAFDTHEVLQLHGDGKVSLFTGNRPEKLPKRNRSKSLVVGSDGSLANAGTGNQIDLRFLFPPEIRNGRPRSGSESSKVRNLIVPELKIQTSDWVPSITWRGLEMCKESRKTENFANK